MKTARYFIFFMAIVSCIEPYNFVVTDIEPSLVVEGFISDKSFNETRNYPSDGRYFTVKLSYTSNVTNVRPTPIDNATVRLTSDEGEEWSYLQIQPGVYQLNDPDFRAKEQVKYKVSIQLNEDIYESNWEAMPSSAVPPIGNVSFEEKVIKVYVVEANETVIRDRQVITANIEVNPNDTGDHIYYKWNFSPTWIYKAPLSPSVILPGYICWATDQYYLRNYAIQSDRVGGYKKDLFTIPTVRNEKIFERFSVLITQHALSEENFTFYKEMMERNEGSALIDVPPFNLQTNLHCVNCEKRVSGYFGVVKEQATRWYFDKSQLSYHVVNTLKADCLVDYGPGGPAPECVDCREYSFGKATNVKPVWWED